MDVSLAQNFVSLAKLIDNQVNKMAKNALF